MRNLGINGILVGHVSSNESQTLHQPKTMNFLGHFGNSLVDMIPFRVVYHRVHRKKLAAWFGYVWLVRCLLFHPRLPESRKFFKLSHVRNSRAKRKYTIQSENQKKGWKGFFEPSFQQTCHTTDFSGQMIHHRSTTIFHIAWDDWRLEQPYSQKDGRILNWVADFVFPCPGAWRGCHWCLQDSPVPWLGFWFQLGAPPFGMEIKTETANQSCICERPPKCERNPTFKREFLHTRCRFQRWSLSRATQQVPTSKCFFPATKWPKDLSVFGSAPEPQGTQPWLSRRIWFKKNIYLIITHYLYG